MFVLPQNSYVAILSPSVMTVGDGASERRLGHESGALMGLVP